MQLPAGRSEPVQCQGIKLNKPETQRTRIIIDTHSSKHLFVIFSTTNCIIFNCNTFFGIAILKVNYHILNLNKVEVTSVRQKQNL